MAFDGEAKSGTTCEWRSDGWNCATFVTECSFEFTFLEEMPDPDIYRYCCFCGKKMELQYDRD